MLEIISTVVFYAMALCIIVGVIFVAAAAFFIIGGLFGIVFGGSTSFVFFGYAIAFGVLGESAVIFGIILGFIGMFFLFVGWVLWCIWALFLPWLRTRLAAAQSTSGALAPGLGSGAFPFPFPFPGLPPLLGLPQGLWGLLFLPPDQRLQLPPNILMLVDCLRGCLCKALCAGDGHGGNVSGGKNPGDVIVDAGKSLLEDLKAQLEAAKKKLEEATAFADVAYWSNKIKDLTLQIANLGGERVIREAVLPIRSTNR